jgi:hypothetical protein
MMTEYEDAEGPYQDAEKEVAIQLRNGTVRDMKKRKGKAGRPAERLITTDPAAALDKLLKKKPAS